MDDDKDYIELVQQAQLGNRESLDTLAGLVRGRLYAYVYRIVLQEHLAQDIVQESMLEMFKVLGKMKRSDMFWPSRIITPNVDPPYDMLLEGLATVVSK